MDDLAPVISIRDTIFATIIGTEALLALLPPWCGLGWGSWVTYFCGATLALLVAMRFVWLR